MALVFAFTMVFPFAAFAEGSGASFSKSTVTGLDKPADDVSLGFVKVSQMNDANDVYVTVELPDKVDYDATAAASTGYVEYYDASAVVKLITGTIVDADEDEMTVKFTPDDLDLEDDYIKILFTGASKVNIMGGAADDINVAVTVKGAESGQEIWAISEELTVGQVSDDELTVTVDDPNTIGVGSEKKLATITFEESQANAVQNNDTVTITLPDDIVWDLDAKDLNSDNKLTGAELNDVVDNGKYGLTVKELNFTDDDELAVTFGGPSAVFADSVELDLLVRVYPDANDGDITVTVSEDSLSCDMDDTDLVVATLGDAEGDITVEDTSDDDIYQGDLDKTIDEITLESSGTFGEDDSIILALSDGARWYLNAADITALEGVAGIEDIDIFDDSQKIWITLDNTNEDEIILEDLTVATLPDAPVGNITVEASGTAGVAGSVVVGEVIAAATVTAEKPQVSLASLDQNAGTITITETKKKAFDASDDGDALTANPDKLVDMWIELPSGVTWADEPTIEVNGDEVTAVEIDDEMCYVNLGSLLSDSKIDEIVVSDVSYDMDTRVRGNDVEVIIGGDIFNRLDQAGNTIVEDLQEDYAEDAILTAANATTVEQDVVTTTFTVGNDGVYVVNGRTLVQVNLLSDTLGLQKYWDAATKTAYFVKDGKVVAFPIDQNKIFINGVAVPVDQGAKIINNYTCVTLRGLQLAFGGDLAWDGATKTATFNFAK